MVHSPQVHQLVNEHVLADEVRHQQEPPVQADVTVATTGAPTRALVADTDTRHGETMLRGQRQQTCRQFAASSIAKRALVIDRSILACQPRALPGDPLSVPAGKRLRLAPRAAARNRNADTSVCIHPQHVSTRAAMSNEIGFNGFNGFNKFSGFRRL